MDGKKLAYCRRKIHFSNAYISAHRRQDINFLFPVLNVAFALISLLTLSINCLQNFVLRVHLNFGYFSATNFWRKIILPLGTGRLSTFLLKKAQRLCVVHRMYFNEEDY
jgi:hypothetical protein